MQEFDRFEEARRWYLEGVDALGDDHWRKPSRCAGWTAFDVVAHVASSDRFIAAAVMAALGGDVSKAVEPESPSTPAVLMRSAREISNQAAEDLRKLSDRSPDAIVRMRMGEVPVNRVVRLRTAEYVIHGYDLEPATGDERPVPGWYFEQTLPWAAENMTRAHQRSPHKGKSASFHLHRTDGQGEWIMRAQGGDARTEAGHGHADVAMRGSAAGLYWVLMGRGSPEEHGVEVVGDPGLASAFKEWFPGP